MHRWVNEDNRHIYEAMTRVRPSQARWVDRFAHYHPAKLLLGAAVIIGCSYPNGWLNQIYRFQEAPLAQSLLWAGAAVGLLIGVGWSRTASLTDWLDRASASGLLRDLLVTGAKPREILIAHYAARTVPFESGLWLLLVFFVSFNGGIWAAHPSTSGAPVFGVRWAWPPAMVFTILGFSLMFMLDVRQYLRYPGERAWRGAPVGRSLLLVVAFLAGFAIILFAGFSVFRLELDRYTAFLTYCLILSLGTAVYAVYLSSVSVRITVERGAERWQDEFQRLADQATD